ncbi:MAG TPA: diguanylate cyclase, partial [Rhizomicrobium sp.]
MFKPDREQAFAKAALALMGGAGIAPTPDNFELFYAYASGENPAITRMMGSIIDSKHPFTPELLSDLRLRCLSSVGAAQVMESLGGNMGTLIDDILGKLESSARDTASYKNALSAATGELGGGEQSPADLRKLVDGLVAATRAMELRAKSLESELQASSQQVNELRSTLADVRKESMTDPLTGISNRKAFEEAVASAIAALAREGEAVTLLLCDIDHFKLFNDTW